MSIVTVGIGMIDVRVCTCTIQCRVSLALAENCDLFVSRLGKIDMYLHSKSRMISDHT